MSDPVLALRGLERVYKTEAGDLPVLRGVDLDVYPGEVVGLIGPSGSGKSSLLHSAGLLERPDAGLVALEGRDCSKLSERARTRIRLGTVGFVYQFHHLLPEFSALENVAMPLTIAGKSRREAEARAKELLEGLGLGHRLNHLPVAQIQIFGNAGFNPKRAGVQLDGWCTWHTGNALRAEHGDGPGSGIAHPLAAHRHRAVCTRGVSHRG